jgi:hypothetical protein
MDFKYPKWSPMAILKKYNLNGMNVNQIFCIFMINLKNQPNCQQNSFFLHIPGESSRVIIVIGFRSNVSFIEIRLNREWSIKRSYHCI